MIHSIGVGDVRELHLGAADLLVAERLAVVHGDVLAALLRDHRAVVAERVADFLGDQAGELALVEGLDLLRPLRLGHVGI